MKILLIDDDINLNKVLTYQLRKQGHFVDSAKDGNTGLEIFKKKQFDIVITDMQMPGISGIEVLQEIHRLNKKVIVIVITAHGSIDNAIEACRLGANDYITKPFGQEQLLFTIQKAVRLHNLQKENIQLKSELYDRNRFKNIIASGKKMNEILRMTEQVAQSDASVLILGESGTGKELIARAIHYNSYRKNEPFITVNCPSIPQNLLESDLFGHLKGSFTGAIKDRIGKFELADKGTLFLDEIGDIPEELQSKLLRVLQEQTIEKLGDSKIKKVDVRVITATNRDLNAMIKAGKFREDLYFRIAVVPIQIPPLRERVEDIPILVKHFIKKYAKDKNVMIGQDALDVLQNHHWPGNVRELENMVERILVFLQKDTIEKNDIPVHVNIKHDPEIQMRASSGTLESIEKNAIKNAIKESNGNKSQAARILNIPRHVLLYKLKKLGLVN